MLFVAVGVLLIVLNLAGIGPFGAWNWELFGDLWKFCAPFVLAALWWWFSDVSGLNKRREMKRDEDRKTRRRQENLAAFGLDPQARNSKKARP
jgi:small Trp-rich protein